MFVQAPDGAGGYRQALALPADAVGDQVGLCALRDGRRVVLSGGWAVQSVAPSLHTAAGDLTLASATLGSSGDLGPDFLASGGGVSVGVGDSLTLLYAPSSGALSNAGSWFVTVARAGASALAAQQQRPAGGTLPVRFALHVAQPNPFRSTTTIRFDLPVASAVRLDVFDTQGRRVQTLADRTYPAGFHAVTWQPARGENGRLGPGVYFCRLEAGAFHARRKVVLTGN
jgi:hypothetical protein